MFTCNAADQSPPMRMCRLNKDKNLYPSWMQNDPVGTVYIWGVWKQGMEVSVYGSRYV